jgi:hypothetical protein
MFVNCPSMELSNGTSKMNYYEARIAIEILYKELLIRNIQPKHIAIICWYKAQVKVVKEMILVSSLRSLMI